MKLIFDIETNGLLPECKIAHCLVVKDADTGEVRRFRDLRRGVPQRESMGAGLALLKKAHTLVGHNILSFDIPALAKVYGFWLHKDVEIIDTLVCSRLIWANLAEMDIIRRRVPPKLIGRHSLKAWGYRLGNLKGEFGETTDWSEWSQEMEDYCAQDVEVAHELYRRILDKGYDPRAIKLEHQFRAIIDQQERWGFRFDVPAAEKLARKLIGIRAEITAELQSVFPPRIETMKTPAYYAAGGKQYETIKQAVEAGHKRAAITAGPPREKEHPFNPGSRIQIAERLRDMHGWKPRQFTPSGQPEISEDTLSGLPYPEAKPLLRYLKVEKILGQLAEGDNAWLKLAKNGRIHGQVVTNGAVTGRCTHNSPNLAQVPKVLVKKDAKGNKVVPMSFEGGFGFECRSLFVADEDWTLVGWDASGLELRCLAHYMARYDDGAYAKVLLEGDVHTENQKAAGLHLRDSAKTFIYAFLYGAGDEKIGSIVIDDCRKAGKPLPKGTQKQLGAALRNRFLKGLPALKKLKDAIDAVVRTRKYLIGLDGRRLHVRSDHAALNTLLQSAGAILMKQALVFMHEALTAEKLTFGKDYAFVANIHDEVQTTCKQTLAEKIGKAGPLALKAAGKHFGFRCPLDGEFKYGPNWAATH